MITDKTAIEEKEKELKAEITELEKELAAAGFLHMDKNGQVKRDKDGEPSRNMVNIKQAVWAAIKKHNIDAAGDLFFTATGAIKTSADVIYRCKEPSLTKLIDYASATKLLNTFVKVARQGCDGYPIHTRFDSLKETGRVGSSNPNLQNLPSKHGIRELFVPRPGNVFIGVDYDTAELRAWGQICKWLFGGSKMADVFQKKGADPHTEFAAKMLGISVEEAYALKESKDKEFKAARDRAKAPNFGFPGGMGVDKFVNNLFKQKQIVMTKEEGWALKNTWAATWPEHKAYFERAARISDGSRMDKAFVSGRYRGGLGFCDAANGPFQSLIADGAKASLYELVKRMYSVPSSALFGCRPAIMVHDEIKIEAPEARAHEAAMEMTEVMISVMQSHMPDVLVEASPLMTRRWTKGADPYYKDGRLLPSEDAKQ